MERSCLSRSKDQGSQMGCLAFAEISIIFLLPPTHPEGAEKAQ
jgi:hypothetical protein